MLSDKLLRALRAKSPFSETELAGMTEAQGWDWIYRNKPAARDKAHQICFTGFGACECEELHALARAAGWLKITTSVTAGLSYLCTGPNAGPSKLEKARKQSVELINRDQFLALISSGELPL